MRSAVHHASRPGAPHPFRAAGFSLAFVIGAMLALAHPPAGAEERPARTAAELMDAVMWGKEPIGGPFALTDQTGQLRTEADFRGRFMLVYFGFTYCPDVCPTDLQTISLALDQLGEAGEKVQPLFITLDPERDTREHLAEYIKMFHPRLLALSGDGRATANAAAAYRVYYAKAPTNDAAGYTIDHSSFVYLMGPDGRYLGFFPPGTAPGRMAAAIRTHLPAPASP